MYVTDTIQKWLEGLNLGTGINNSLSRTVAAVAALLVGIIVLYIARWIVRKVLYRAIKKTSNIWDDILIKKKVLLRLTLLAPAVIFHFSIPVVFGDIPGAESFAYGVLSLYVIAVFVLVANAILNVLYETYLAFPISREIPLTSFIQVLKILLYFGAAILCISVVFDKSPVILFSGLGAMTAVLLLVFKDPILGFVAGIQLISNKMLRHGDWIEMPKYGADGDVMDITLTTVKVRNFDKTITTIPTYALITDSYKNWRGMEESGGRRIKRAIRIDVGSVKFCDEEMVERFKKIRHISAYIEKKKQELSEYNAALGLSVDNLVNSRRLTNIGTYRAYVIAYLKNHPMINQNMTFLVRQLPPDEYGLPLEIYVFSKDKAWANYEAIQADIFDHLMAILPEFDLHMFQRPSGGDLQRAIHVAEE